MSTLKVQMKFKLQSSDKKYFGMSAFDLDLAFGLCHLIFWTGVER
jgi:hypothetical protein